MAQEGARQVRSSTNDGPSSQDQSRSEGSYCRLGRKLANRIMYIIQTGFGTWLWHGMVSRFSTFLPLTGLLDRIDNLNPNPKVVRARLEPGLSFSDSRRDTHFGNDTSALPTLVLGLALGRGWDSIKVVDLIYG